VLTKLYFCKGGDRFGKYVVLDQEETNNLLSSEAEKAFGDCVLVVHIGDGEIVGLPGNMEVELIDGLQ